MSEHRRHIEQVERFTRLANQAETEAERGEHVRVAAAYALLATNAAWFSAQALPQAIEDLDA